MIKSGLHFGESFEMAVVPECNNVLHAIRPMIQILFTFTQLYFVFFSSKVSCGFLIAMLFRFYRINFLLSFKDLTSCSCIS